MNPVAAMLVAYACIVSPAFAACESPINHKPDRLNITEATKCPPTDAEAIEAAIRSIASLGAALEKNAEKWKELNQTLERLNKHISAAPAPFRVESPAAAVKPMRAVKRKSRLAQLNPNVPGWVLRRKHECGSETPTWYWNRKLKSWRHGCNR